MGKSQLETKSLKLASIQIKKEKKNCICESDDKDKEQHEDVKKEINIIKFGKGQ